MKLVLVHGMLGAPSMFDATIDELTRRRPTALPEIVRPWLPGHGPTPWGVGLGSFADVASAFADRLPSGPLCLVGYSLGGRLSLAMRRPNIRARVLIGAHLGLRTAGERSARRAWEVEMRDLVLSGGLPALVAAWERLPLFASQAALPLALLSQQRRVRLAHVPAAIGWAFDVLGTGAMPLLDASGVEQAAHLWVVAGERDAAYRAMNERAAETLGARPLSIASVGHNVALEAPAALARVIDEALTELAQSSEPALDPRGASSFGDYERQGAS